MKKIPASLLLSIILLLVPACQEDEAPVEPCTPATTDQIRFDGISPTDESGQPTGSEDPTDWNLDDQWENRIFDLFDGMQNNLCPDREEYQAFQGYPNPAGSQIALMYDLKEPLDLELRLVDRDYILLKAIDINDTFVSGVNTTFLRLDDLNISGDTIRIYYRLLGNGCELRGHGDVLVQ